MPIPLRSDFNADKLRAAARQSADAEQVRRLLALSMIYDGESRAAAARVGGVTVQAIRDWVVKFNEEGPPGLIHHATGQASRLNDAHRAALFAMIEEDVAANGDGGHCRLHDLAQKLKEEFALSVSLPTLSREVRALGLRTSAAWRGRRSRDPKVIKAMSKRLLHQPA